MGDHSIFPASRSGRTQRPRQASCRRSATRAGALAAAVVLALSAGAAAQTYTPSVASNAALTAASTATYPNGVWRLDFGTHGSPAVQNGAPPVYYLPNYNACSINSGAGDNGGQVKSADGYCWIAHFSSSNFDVREWGAVGDFNGTSGTDNSGPINAAIAYALSATQSAPGYPSVVLGGGGPYGIADPINIPANANGLVLGDGTGRLVALSSSAFPRGTWPPPDPWNSTYTAPIGMVNIPSTAQDITINIAVIDGNTQCGVSGVVNASQTKIYLHGDIVNFGCPSTNPNPGAYGIFNTGGLRDNFCHIEQQTSKDSTTSDRSGYGIYQAAAHDTRFIDCTVNYAIFPIYVDSASIDFQFHAGHIYNGATSGSGYVPLDAVLNSGASITDSTIDDGTIQVSVPAGSTQPPPVIIANDFFEYESGKAQCMAAWINFVTPTADTGSATTFTTDLAVIANDVFPQATVPNTCAQGAGTPVLNLQLSVQKPSSGSWTNAAYEAQALINNPTLGDAHPGYIAGHWYLPGQQGPVAASPSPLGAGTMVCVPGLVSSAVTVEALAVNVVTAAASGNLQLAIYSSSGPVPPFDAPQTLLASTPNIGTGSTGMVSGALSSGLQLAAGVYWFCEQADSNGGGAVLQSFDTGSPMPVLAMIASNDPVGSLGASKNAGWTTTVTPFPTWPSSFGSGSYQYTKSPNAPVTAFQVQSSP